MYLFFDTETTGLPKNWKAPVSEVDNWPRMVQLAFLVFFQSGENETPNGEPVPVIERNFIIKPDGFTIPEDVSRIHGITHERAMDEGWALREVLEEFHAQVIVNQTVVAHNVSFDRAIVGSEFIRAGMEDVLHGKDRVCTMMKTTKFCNLPGKYGPKWPKLSELHEKLFGHTFEEAHNASVDINATAKCFFELKRRQLI
jgi:DNA polymerase III epsilon subunit-like protein